MRAHQPSSAERGRPDEAGAESRPGGLLVIPLATALIDSDGRILHWSEDAERLLGYPAAEAVGRYAAHLLVTEDERPEVLGLFGRIVSGEEWAGVFPVRHRDGHRVELEFRTHPVSGPGGRRLVLAVAADVAGLSRLQADLAVLDNFFRQSPIGLAVYDTDLRFVRVNAALAAMNGMPPEQHLGRRPGEVLPGVDSRGREAVLRGVLETGRPVLDVRSSGRTPADPEHDHAWSASYFRLQDARGRVFGVCSSVYDVTERFRAEAEAARARDRLALLVEATAKVGTTLDLRETARELVSVMVPRLADVSSVFVRERLVTGDGLVPAEPGGAELLRRLAVASADPGFPVWELPADEVHRVDEGSPFAEAMATGRTCAVPASALGPLVPEAAPRLRAYISDRQNPVRVTPLVARGTVLGLMVYGRSRRREPFEAQDITLGDELASRAAVFVDNARLYTREHRISVARQQALQEANTARERLAMVNEASTRIGTTLDIGQTARELAEVSAPRLADAVIVEVLESVAEGTPAGRPAPEERPDRPVVLRRMAFHQVEGAGGLDPLCPVGDVHGFHPSTPYGWSLAHSRPVLIPRLDEEQLGRWLAHAPERAARAREQGVHSVMVVPLVARGSALGVAAFHRTVTRRPFGEEDLALAGELAYRAAVSMDNGRLYASERDAARLRQQALEEAHAAQERLALINEASSRIGTTLDVQRTAEELVDVVVPRFADLVTVDLLDSVLRGEEPGSAPAPERPDQAVVLRAVAVGRTTEAGTAPITDAVGETSEFDPSGAYAESIRTGRPVLIREVDEESLRKIVATAQRVAPALAAGVHSYLMVPLLARGAVLGGAEFVRLRGSEPFGSADVALAEELVARAAVCVDNARLYRRERATALTLQRSLLPQEVHRTLGLEIAHRYLPSSVVSEVGGDWFDVVPLSSGRVALVVGDVMGHGIRAAATMGQIRTGARTLVTLDLFPDQVLTRLDETASGIGEGQFATCVCAVYDPVDRRCTVSSAGHLPPVVVGPDGAGRIIDVPPGVPLGVGGVPFESVDFALPEGAVLALYTDGLVEHRGRDIEDGIRLLCRTIAAGHGRSLEETCDAVLAALDTGQAEDDIAVIMAQAVPVPQGSIATLPLTEDMATVSEARAFTLGTLQSWGLSVLCEFAELLVSELVTNALLHAGAPRQLRLLYDRVVTLEVTDIGRTAPRLRRTTDEDEGGRGLHLVNELAHRWGSRPARYGKVVWVELELPAGAAPAHGTRP